MTNRAKEAPKKWQLILLIILTTALINYGLGFISGNLAATLKIVLSLACVVGIIIVIAIKPKHSIH